MALHEFTLDDLSKRSGDRRRMALEALLVAKQNIEDLADAWKVHVNSAYKVLERLRAKGLVSRGAGSKATALYSITDQGVKKLRWLTSQTLQEAPETPKAPKNDLGVLYPESDLSGGLLDGPVALMRPVEVTLEDFRNKGVHGLPSKMTLSEDDIYVEPKYDGWLDQVVNQYHYSRRGKLLSGKFPPIDLAIHELRQVHLLGELVYWGPGGRMNESVITSIAGSNQKEALMKFAQLEGDGGFFQVVLFDILMNEGDDVSTMPFEDRRDVLETLFDSIDNREDRVTLSPVSDFDEWAKVFRYSLSHGGEGVLLKNKKAPYFWRPEGDREPSPVGTQWKVKQKRTDNFVVFAAYRSEKKSLMLRFGQYWRGELVEVGEVNNLSEEHDQEFIRRLAKGPVLVELEFQERFPKPPGKLRSPVFKRFRDDVALTEDNAKLPRQFAP
jgi:ATP-dependent DNA ligase